MAESNLHVPRDMGSVPAKPPLRSSEDTFVPRPVLFDTVTYLHVPNSYSSSSSSSLLIPRLPPHTAPLTRVTSQYKPNMKYQGGVGCSIIHCMSQVL